MCLPFPDLPALSAMAQVRLPAAMEEESECWQWPSTDRVCPLSSGSTSTSFVRGRHSIVKPSLTMSFSKISTWTTENCPNALTMPPSSLTGLPVTSQVPIISSTPCATIVLWAPWPGSLHPFPSTWDGQEAAGRSPVPARTITWSRITRDTISDPPVSFWRTIQKSETKPKDALLSLKWMAIAAIDSTSRSLNMKVLPLITTPESCGQSIWNSKADFGTRRPMDGESGNGKEMSHSTFGWLGSSPSSRSTRFTIWPSSPNLQLTCVSSSKEGR